MSLNLVNPFMKFASGGAPSTSTALDDGILMGGSTSPWSVTDRVMHWDGTNWSNGTVLPAGRQFNAGGGNTSDAIMMGGGNNAGASNAFNTTYTWNGSSWTTGGTMGLAEALLAGGGDSSDAVWCGGSPNGGTSYVDYCEVYNGSPWSAVTNIDQNLYSKYTLYI